MSRNKLMSFQGKTSTSIIYHHLYILNFRGKTQLHETVKFLWKSAVVLQLPIWLTQSPVSNL